MMTCQELADRLRRAAIKAHNELDMPTEALMMSVSTQAKAVLGTYAYGWPQLAASTQADRVRKGFAANEPLLRTGEMRESIRSEAVSAGFGAEGVVYSVDQIAVYQELGTKNIPARPFLMSSMIRCAPRMRVVFNKFAEGIFV